MPNLPSRSAIDRAGGILRDWWKDPARDMDEETLGALEIVWNYRLSFRKPLKKVTVGVRQFVQRESAEVLVSERLKRLSTIVDKLSRLPAMKVTRMQDIGGCRSILHGGRPEMEGVLRRIEKNKWDVRRFRDYISEPRDTGYRAIHVVVKRDGREIEIQLRTRRQHAWAAEVERVGARLGYGLKDGVGPDDLLDFYRLAADILALQDEGAAVDVSIMREFQRRLDTVRPQYEV